MRKLCRSQAEDHVLLAAVFVLAGALAAPAQAKTPVPGQAAQAKVKKLIAELYQEDLRKAKLPAERTALAQKILQQAMKAKAGSADHFVLLKEARDIAAEAGDVETALKAARDIWSTYEVDAAEMEIETLIETGHHAGLINQRKVVLERTVPLVAAALMEDDFATASRLMEMAVPAARGTREGELIKQVVGLEKRIEAAQEAYGKVQGALKVLKDRPTDPQANLTVGWYYSVHKGDWDKGIPMLALGGDDQLKALAIKELKGPTLPDARVALADAWWELAQGKEGYEKDVLLLRAGYWYGQGQRKLTSPLTQMRVQQRLVEIARLTGSVGGMQPAPLPRLAPRFDEEQLSKEQQACARRLGVPVVVSNSIGMKLVLIPPGEFQMGSSQEEIDRLLKQAKEEDRPKFYTARIAEEGPRHRVRITRPVYLGVYEVTQAEFQSVMGSNPSMYSPTGQRRHKVAGEDTSCFPVEMVSWEDAVEFCRKLSALEREKSARRVYRLPTEAEWEYACRAGSTTRYHFGNDAARLGAYAWFGTNSLGRTHLVGQKDPNAWGLYDMHGNVNEWCMDRHGADYYQNSASRDPTGPASGRARVVRGLSFDTAFPEKLRCASRGGSSPDSRLSWIGFRVAMTPAR